MPPQNTPEPTTSQQPATNSQPPLATPQGAPMETAPQKRRIPKWLKVVGVIVAAFIVLIVAGVLVANIATRAPQKVSDQFISDIQAGNTPAAYALTSKAFQQTTSQDQLNTIIEQVGPVLKGQVKVTGRNIQKSTGIPTTSVLVYTDKTSSNGTHYIKTELQKNSGVWQIINFRSSATPLSTTVE